MNIRMHVYKLSNEMNDKLYIGSTKSSLAKRLRQHKCSCKDGKSQLYKAMREIGAEKFNIELLVECDELRKREQMFIDAFQAIDKGYNQLKAYLSDEERRLKKKEYNNTKMECVCGGHFLRKHRARHLRTKKHQSYISV